MIVPKILEIVILIIFVFTVHEAGHILAIILTKAGKVKGLAVNWRGIGVKWETNGYEPFKRSVVSLSGSVVNLAFAVLFFSVGLEMLGFANLVFGVVNLFPLPGSDGLRALANLKAAA